jgi:integrase
MWVEKHGKTYRVRDRLAGELVTLSAGYPTKKAAQDGRDLLRAEQLRGDQLVPRGGTITLDDWLDEWWPGYEAGLTKPSARISAAGIIRRYVRPMLGHMALQDVDEHVVRRWVADLLAGRTAVSKPRRLAPKTVRNAHGQLHRVMVDAVRRKLIRANPCQGTDLPDPSRDEQRFLTEAEAERLLAAVPERWRTLILLLLLTGLRWGEAVGLRVGKVDLANRRLVVAQQLQELNTGPEGIVYVAPKSKRSRRTVAFPGRLAEALHPLVAGHQRDALVFRAAEGGPVRYRHFYRRIWLPTLKRSKLEGLRLHDLRHTHATWLISAGVPILAISRRLGHATISITMDLYGHLLPEVDDSIIASLDGTLDKIDSGSSVGAAGGERPGAERSGPDESAGQAA